MSINHKNPDHSSVSPTWQGSLALNKVKQVVRCHSFVLIPPRFSLPLFPVYHQTSTAAAEILPCTVKISMTRNLCQDHKFRFSSSTLFSYRLFIFPEASQQLLILLSSWSSVLLSEIWHNHRGTIAAVVNTSFFTTPA